MRFRDMHNDAGTYTGFAVCSLLLSRRHASHCVPFVIARRVQRAHVLFLELGA
jgi:hypothetical protein